MSDETAKADSKNGAVCGICGGTNFDDPEDVFCHGCGKHICKDHTGMPMGRHVPEDHDLHEEDEDEPW